MRLIDADALREAMYHEAFEKDSDMQKWESGCWIRYKMFEKCIEAAPTIEDKKVIEDYYQVAYAEGYKAGMEKRKAEAYNEGFRTALESVLNMFILNMFKGATKYEDSPGEQQ